MEFRSNKEKFWAKMAGEDIEMPKPETREEEFMKSMALAIGGQNDVDIPAPITREEKYKAKVIKNLEDVTLDLEEKTIIENGVYTAKADDKDGFSKVTVTVPNTYTNEDEGKVVSSGALVAQSARSESITINGTYDTTMNNSVTVAVDGNANVADGTGVFKLCSALNRIDIPRSGYTSIGTDSFRNCTNLTSIILPSGITSIGGYAFMGCTNLTSINVPSGVTSIGENTFNDCTGLQSIDLPSTLTDIGMQAFYGCSHLTSIICRATTPPTLGALALGNVFARCTIYVPAESVDTYKAASGWSARANYIQAIPTT